MYPTDKVKYTSPFDGKESDAIIQGVLNNDLYLISLPKNYEFSTPAVIHKDNYEYANGNSRTIFKFAGEQCIIVLGKDIKLAAKKSLFKSNWKLGDKFHFGNEEYIVDLISGDYILGKRVLTNSINSQTPWLISQIRHFMPEGGRWFHASEEAELKRAKQDNIPSTKEVKEVKQEEQAEDFRKDFRKGDIVRDPAISGDLLIKEVTHNGEWFLVESSTSAVPAHFMRAINGALGIHYNNISFEVRNLDKNKYYCWFSNKEINKCKLVKAMENNLRTIFTTGEMYIVDYEDQAYELELVFSTPQKTFHLLRYAGIAPKDSLLKWGRSVSGTDSTQVMENSNIFTVMGLDKNQKYCWLTDYEFRKTMKIEPSNKANKSMDIISRAKANGKVVGYKVARKKLTQAVKAALIATLAPKGSKKGKAAMLNEVLSSKEGEGLIQILMGMSPHLPAGIGEYVQKNEHMMAIADDLQTEGAATLVHEFSDKFLKYIAPALGDVLKSVAEVEEQQTSERQAKQEKSLTSPSKMGTIQTDVAAVQPEMVVVAPAANAVVS